MASEYPIDNLAQEIFMVLIEDEDYKSWSPEAIARRAVTLSVSFHQELEKYYDEPQ